MRKSSLVIAWMCCSLLVSGLPATAEELQEITDTDPKRNADNIFYGLKESCPGLALTDYTGQLKVLDVKLKERPYDGRLLRSRARALYALGNYDRALEDLNKAVQYTDGYPHSGAFLDRAQVLAKLKRYDDALKDCVSGQRYNCGSWMSWAPFLMAARIYTQMGDTSSAESAAQNSLYVLKMSEPSGPKEPYKSELLKLTGGKTDKLQQHKTGIEEYLKNAQQLTALSKAPTNSELATILGLEKFPSDGETDFLYNNENVNSMWAKVMRYGEDRIVVVCDPNVCSLLEPDIKKTFTSWPGAGKLLETKNASIEFTAASPTVACCDITIKWLQ